MDEAKFNEIVRAKVESGNLSTEELRELHELLKERAEYKRFNKSEYFTPYPYQKKFFNAGKDYRYRFLMAGNRTGKTFSAAYESFLQLTGLYPDWWEGRRFRKPINFWFLSVDVEQGKDVGQFELFGTKNAKAIEEIGSGSIPRKYIDLDSLERDGARILRARIKHFTDGVHDGWSTISFKTSQADQSSLMGSHLDYVWSDELPPFNDLDIFNQLVTRTMADKTRNASVTITGTPEKGNTPLVEHFRENSGKEGDSLFWMQAGWNDAPHLTKEIIADMIKTIPAYQLEMRMNGEPILGDGMVFPYNIRETAVIQPIEIPDHWKRIAGVDIGLAHPTACVWSAYDPETDTIYLTDSYQLENATPEVHAISINQRGRDIPIVLPRDAHQRQKDTKTDMINAYKNAGVNVLSETFYNAGRAYKGERNNHVDPGIVEMSQRLQTGQLKIFANNQELIRGFEMYAYEKGVINKKSKGDDLLDAARYSIMSVARRGKSKREVATNTNQPIGINWRTI